MLSIHIVGCNQSRFTMNAILSAALYAPTPFEILVLENGSDDASFDSLLKSPSIRAAVEFRGLPMDTVIKIFRLPDRNSKTKNFGLAAGLNMLGSFMDSATTHIAYLHSDMFFYPESLIMLKQDLDKSPGIACCDVITAAIPGMDQQHPHPDDVYKRIEPNPCQEPGFGFPFMLTKETYKALRDIDIWANRKPLAGNTCGGIFDERIDISAAGSAFIDTDLFIRARQLPGITDQNLAVRMVSGAFAYHYLSGTRGPSAGIQTITAKANLLAKYRAHSVADIHWIPRKFQQIA